MDPISASSAGAAVFQTFLKTYQMLDSQSEEERLRESTLQAAKKFIFFYEDTHWGDITGEEAGLIYRNHFNETANGFREIAVKVDGELDDEVVSELREISGDLEREAMDEPLVAMGGPTRGEKLKEKVREPYQRLKDLVDRLEEEQ